MSSLTLPGAARFVTMPAAARRAGGHAPLDRERTVGPEQIIVSKTDLKGIITYANAVFSDVSGYPQHSLLGQSHNIVRHPEFPGGVFEIMWRTIEAGQEIFAFVKNLARDGSYYWVLAHITPIFDVNGTITGYHSSRRAAERAAIAAIEPVYAHMMEIEAEQVNRHRAAQTSAAWLEDELARRGTTYDAFVWDIVNRTAGGE